MIQKFIDYFYALRHHIYLDSKTKNFLELNKIKWEKNKISDTKNIILVDFFDWYPWILLWSIFSNKLSQKYKAKICYYYFPLYKSILSNNHFFLRVRKKIYNSFNAHEILNELNFTSNKNYNLDYNEIIKSKNDLIRFKYKGIVIGDLIYDSYLRSTYSFTIDNLRDDYLIKLFYRAIKIFDEIQNLFEKNIVKAVISSHTCYVQYGLMVRFACKKKIPVYITPGIAWGSKRLSIKKVDVKTLNNFDPYYKYNKIFSKFDIKQKNKCRRIGKKILIERFRGNFKKFLPHIHKIKSQEKNIIEKFSVNQKKKFVIYTHCFWDYVHKFRYAIFPDFYEWVVETIKILEDNHDCQIFLKPHPNGYQNNVKILKQIKKNFPEIVILSNFHDLNYIVNLKPDLVITVFGSVGHELPFKNICVLNAGDNLHVNYNFNLTAKNYLDYKNKIINYQKYKKKINFTQKKHIYEFCYMHYVHFYNLNDREKLIKDDMFSYDNLKLSNSSNNLAKFCKQFNRIFINFSKYFNNIFKST